MTDNLHGFVVVQHGQTLIERYGEGDDFAWDRPLGHVVFDAGTLHDVRSVTKSVVALLYGIALADGHVPEPSAPLLASFPEYPDLAADPARARLTVAHALTMSLGLEWREEIPYSDPANGEIAMDMAPDRNRYVLERPVAGPPGERWAYSGGASALLGHLITAGTGRPLRDYARERLFTPLGIGTFEWMAAEDGVFSAASGLRLTARDLARVGELVLAGGEGVVPSSWLTEMLTPRLTVEWGDGYGYQWYLGSVGGRAAPSALGNGGQRLVVLPSLSAVVAITAGNYDDPEQWRLPDHLLNDVALPALTSATHLP
ncbi:CubicO group peptidase (beta-lactamase class C family) [Catenuloplanes nepalensis]|uniref:CubicO group peptidase (Beta-lactamase class C family) n=1 Tax=Catenuloplanes nepalensis TaxID=587533 RepID=A0ABT9MSP5_9ACTN|nr:serine hydrolase [Catenuloplanes nepalensis]MDP9794296.1 CubicO group peptidase (beta-lactamase class C family) [Catenuloplanes nepalensis]